MRKRSLFVDWLLCICFHLLMYVGVLLSSISTSTRKPCHFHLLNTISISIWLLNNLFIQNCLLSYTFLLVNHWKFSFINTSDILSLKNLFLVNLGLFRLGFWLRLNRRFALFNVSCTSNKVLLDGFIVVLQSWVSSFCDHSFSFLHLHNWYFFNWQLWDLLCLICICCRLCLL